MSRVLLVAAREGCDEVDVADGPVSVPLESLVAGDQGADSESKTCGAGGQRALRHLHEYCRLYSSPVSCFPTGRTPPDDGSDSTLKTG